MERRKVTYDCDDVLMKLNEYVTERVGIKLETLTRYKLSACKITPETEKEMIRIYKLGNTFDCVAWHLGVLDTVALSKEEGVEFLVNTACLSEEVMIAKRKRLLGIGFSEENINLQLTPAAGIGKKMNESYIWVEDNLENLLKADCKYRILIDRPWNQWKNYSEYADRMGEVIRAENLLDANRKVRELLK